MKKKKDKPPMRLRAVARDIITEKYLSKKDIDKITNKFYAIMKKHGIKQGTRTGKHAIQIANAEWSMCKDLFMQRILSQINISMLFESNLPKELEAYD